jgi:excisionase family DNA binding protein
MERYLTTAEAGEILGVSAQRVWQFCRDGRIVGTEKSGRDWRIPKSSLENFKIRPPGRPRKMKNEIQ